MIRRHPALRTLAYRGVIYDEAANRVFHHEGRRAMRRPAEALELCPASYDARSDTGGLAVSGGVTLHGEEVWVRLSLGPFGPDHEVAFRRGRGRDDHCGDRNRWVDQ